MKSQTCIRDSEEMGLYAALFFNHLKHHEEKIQAFEDGRCSIQVPMSDIVTRVVS